MPSRAKCGMVYLLLIAAPLREVVVQGIRFALCQLARVSEPARTARRWFVPAMFVVLALWLAASVPAAATGADRPVLQDTTPTEQATATPTAAPVRTARSNTENILVLGADPRPGDKSWRTDTIMVVAIDYQKDVPGGRPQVGVISVPRDLWVNIPGYGNGRINQADYIGEGRKPNGGGPALVSEILNNTLGVRTTHYVRIRQEGLVELVDALGGVTVTLDCPLNELTPNGRGGYNHFNLPAGKNFLDGAAAKKFATFRYASNDFSRASRQQQLIWAIRERALQIDAIPKIPQLWQALSKTFTTDLSLLDVIRFARLGSQLDAGQVHGVVFSTRALANTVMSGGAQVLVVRSRTALMAEVDSLFAGKPIAEQGRQGSGRCPN